MPKRKSDSPSRGSSSTGASTSARQYTLSSFDAALDVLATQTFTRLDSLVDKFEVAAGITIAPGQAKARWDEAVKRYLVMKSMEVLSCTGSSSARSKGEREDRAGAQANGHGHGQSVDRANGMSVDGDGAAADRNDDGRVVSKPYLGPIHLYGLCTDEEQQWRRWKPRSGDVVLIDLPDDGVWPGKVIDTKAFYQGRTVPKGNHYFPVRIFNESIDPCVMVKSRLLPLHLRPAPPLLAPEHLQSAYHHALCPDSFDTAAHAREQIAAQSRSNPGGIRDPAEIKAEKERWNEQVNWVMNERRAEKMRALAEEREKRLAALAVDPNTSTNGIGHGGKENGTGHGYGCWEDNVASGTGVGGSSPKSDGDIVTGKKKRKTLIPLPEVKKWRSESPLPTNTIFGPNVSGPSALLSTPRRTGSPALMGGMIRPGLGLATVTRPLSPRRTEKRRSVYSGVGEYSPNRGRGGTWTPPRILPSGDETAPVARRYGSLAGVGRGQGHGEGALGMMQDGEDVQLRSSPIPSVKFDFVSPFGPVAGGRLAYANGHASAQDMGEKTLYGMTDSELDVDLGASRQMHRTGSLNGLEAVKEDPVAEEDGWTVVVNGRKGRAVGDRRGDYQGRAGSAPCEASKGSAGVVGTEGGAGEDMEL